MMTEVYAKEGMWLTQSHLENEDERIFLKSVKTLFPEGWRDASNAEKEKWEADHQDDNGRE